MFSSIIKTTGSITGLEYLICSGVSFVFGFIVALVHMYKNTYSKNVVITLAVLPYVVQTMLMLVNGSIGAGIAVMGAFSLVRFRSAQGNAREIMSIFYALTIGLAMSLGYIGIAAFVLVFTGAFIILFNSIDFGVMKGTDRMLKIIIPEDIDYEGVFDDIFDKYTSKWDLVRCKTTNMGSLYKLTLNVTLKDKVSTREFLDELRTRNGNLDISLQRAAETADAL